MSTFTIAPSLAYYIKNGKIAEPVNISVVTGNVMETLNEIDGLSNETEIMSFILGGCGKMEQFPLPVGFGGPYVRVNNLNVQ
jgi:TldD protein